MSGQHKYTSWEDLINAFRSGELDPKKYTVVMDNDCSWLRYVGDDMDEEEADDHAHSLFAGGGYRDIVDVLQAVGISAEWC